MSRHARRGTRDEQDWGPGGYPADDEGPLDPDDYPSQPGWGPEPSRQADPEGFPAPGQGYPGHPDPGGRGAAYHWTPDPLDADPRRYDPLTRPQAPDRWTPPGPAEPWRSAWQDPAPPPAPDPPRRPAPGAAAPGADPWRAPPPDTLARPYAPGGQPSGYPGDRPPPPGALPGPEHPSGPLSPLPPQQNFGWHQPDAATLPPRPGYGAGFETGPPQRLGQARRAVLPPARAGQPDPGYDRYVDDARELDRSPHQDPGEPAATGDWYGDGDESPAWAGESQPGGFLPGLDQEGADRPAGEPPAGASARKKRRRRGRVAILASLLVFVLIVVAGGAVGYHYYRKYIAPPDFPGPGTGSVLVQIKPGDTAGAVGQRLATLGVVASGRAFFNAAKDNPRGNTLEPGTYRVRAHMKASLALALLLAPSSRVQVRVLIPEGFTLAQIIARLGQETGNLKGYQQAIAHPASLGLPAYAHGDPEGYLFPATYEIQPKTPPTTVLRMMVQKFTDEAVSINLKGAAARGNQGQGEVITVASLIEAEGKLPQDYPRIAEVIYNRLNHGINLQLDTTVLYAMARAHKGSATFSTTFPSPYNTYLHANLPPGPIDSPGAAAIHAALHPDHGGFRYFLTINSASGKTLFFSSSQQFDTAVKKYGSTGKGTGTHAGSG